MKYIKLLLAVLCGLSIVGGSVLAQTYVPLKTIAGGTGTSTPSGILYGDNGSTTHLNTVIIGTGCTFSAGTLNCPGTGGSSFSGPANSIITSNAAGNALIATGTQVTTGSFLATSTTGTSQIGGALFTGAAAIAGLGTSNSQLQISQNVNNLARQLDLANINMGANALSSLTFENGNSTNAGASSAYIGGLVFGGPNFATAGFSGLAPNGLALYNTDGPIAIGAISSNSASSSLTFYSGNNSSFAAGNPDMILSGGTANLGLGTSSPYSKLSVVGTIVSANHIATSTTATSTIAAAGLQIGPTVYDASGYDNLLTLIPKRTFGNSSNSQFKEGVLDIDGTLSSRILLNIVQQSTAGTGSSPEMVNIQNQSTSATGILVKVKTASTQFSGNLGVSIEGPTAPALELNQNIWNGGTLQQGGGLFQISSRDNNFTIDARNNTNSGYCRQLDLSPDFSSTTAGTLTLFPCLNSGGSTQLGTGRLNVNGTTTVAHLANFNSTNTATEGDVMTILENGTVGIASSTPSPTAKLSVGGQIYTSSGIRFSDGSVQTAAAQSSHPYTFATTTAITSATAGSVVYATSTLMGIPASTLTASSTIIAKAVFSCGSTTTSTGNCNYFFRDDLGDTLATITVPSTLAATATYSCSADITIQSSGNSASSQIYMTSGSCTSSGVALNVLNLGASGSSAVALSNARSYGMVIANSGSASTNTTTLSSLSIVITP